LTKGSTLAARLVVALLLSLVLALAIGAAPEVARAAQTNATLTSPTDGTQYFDPVKAFTWTPGTGATGYWLWVGTSPGANDVVNSKMLSGTSYVAKGLPPGRTLYARLWTYRNNVAASAPDVTFTASSALTAPTAGTQNLDTTRPFTWSADSTAVSYRLTIGTTQGASDLADSGLTSTTSFAPPGLPAGRTLWARLTTNYPAATVTSDVSFTAAVRTATLSSPSNGAQLFDPVRPFTWSQPGGADAYWLWVGTSPGASDVASSRQITATSYVASGVPPGKTLYARLWTVSGNVWASAPDVAFTAAPSLTFPANGAQNADTSKPFTWQADPQATSYRLSVGTSPGASDLVDSGQLVGTSYTIPGVPAGRTLYARLTTYYGLSTATSDTTFSAKVRTAQLTFPTSGGLHLDPGAAFTWNQVGAADGYWLWVGTTPGSSDLVNSGQISGSSYKPSGLPTGKTLYARLWTLNNGFWGDASEVSFSLAPRLTNPTDGAQDVDTRQPFTWSSDSTATSYRLTVGTAQGGSDLVDSGQITATSYLVPGLPAGRTLYARLTTKYGATTTATSDVSFTARVRAATLTTPSGGWQYIDTTKPFKWNATGGADAYWLWIGSSPGSNDLLDSGELTGTSYTLQSPLPPGKTYYARLWTRSGNIWADSPELQFTSIVGATTITSPLNGAQGVDSTKPITWDPVQGAESYWLWVGTSQGASDLVSTGQITSTSYTSQGLPAGKTLWARVYTLAAGKQVASKDISFTVSPSLSYPKDGARGVDATKPFTWPSDAQAQSYRLSIGTTKGASDVLDSGQITATSYRVHGLPSGTTLYARLTTQYASSTASNDISFAVAPSFKYPATGSLGIDPNTPFSWSPAAGANGNSPTYRLLVGTAPGGNDLYDSGSITGTSAQVPLSALPVNTTLYARVNISPGDGSTMPADTVFTVAGSAPPSAQMTYPQDGQTGVDTSEPFRWTFSPLVDAYRLKLSSGGSVVRDSGPLHVDRYFLEDLAAGQYTGTLEIQVGGQWQTSSSFSFTVATTGSSMTKEIATAEYQTSFVRQMADKQSYPYPWTPLYSQVHNHGDAQAICSDFAPTLVSLLKEARVAQRLPASQQPDGLDIGLMDNGVDVHTLVKLYNTDIGDWMMLDPMFGLTMRRASDGRFATPQEASSATASQSWNSIQYDFLSPFGDYFARNYYIDYPQLFLNVVPTATWRDPHPYMTQVSPPTGTTTASYAIASNQTPVTVLINGKSQTLDVSSSTGLTTVVLARTIALPAGSSATIQVYKLNRSVF
jgi:hypothetical protein